MVSKEDKADNRDEKGSATIDFLEKGAIVNSASNCQILRRNDPLFQNIIFDITLLNVI